MASRILGMGDVLTLIEKAQNLVTEEQAKKLEKKFQEARFTLDDYLEQFDNLKKMGNMSDILAMIPGANKNFSADDLDEKKLARFKCIIQSMTKGERENPNILNSSRKKRIARGSGTTIQEINQLIKQYEQTNQMMKQFKNNKRGGLASYFK